MKGQRRETLLFVRGARPCRRQRGNGLYVQRCKLVQRLVEFYDPSGLLLQPHGHLDMSVTQARVITLQAQGAGDEVLEQPLGALQEARHG